MGINLPNSPPQSQIKKKFSMLATPELEEVQKSAGTEDFRKKFGTDQSYSGKCRGYRAAKERSLMKIRDKNNVVALGKMGKKNWPQSFPPHISNKEVGRTIEKTLADARR